MRMHASHRTLPRLVLSLVGIALIGAAIALVLHSGSSSSAAPASVSADAAQLQNFAVLRGAERVKPTVPADLARMLDGVMNANRLSLARDGIRQLEVADGTDAWVIPGDGAMCFAAGDAEGVGLACGPTSDAIAGKLTVIQRSVGGGEDAVIGLAPDSVSNIATTTATGSATVVAEGNLYVRRGRDLKNVRLLHADGSASSIAVH